MYFDHNLRFFLCSPSDTLFSLTSSLLLSCLFAGEGWPTTVIGVFGWDRFGAIYLCLCLSRKMTHPSQQPFTASQLVKEYRWAQPCAGSHRCWEPMGEKACHIQKMGFPIISSHVLTLAHHPFHDVPLALKWWCKCPIQGWAHNTHNTLVSYESLERLHSSCERSIHLPVCCTGAGLVHSALSAAGERCVSAPRVYMPAGAAGVWPLIWKSWICWLILESMFPGWSGLKLEPFWLWMFSALDLFSEKISFDKNLIYVSLICY